MASTERILITPVNESYIKIDCEDRSVLVDVYEHFTYEVPGAKWDPRVRNGYWDGQKHLLNIKDRTLYRGVLPDLLEFLHSEGHQVECLVQDEKNHLDESFLNNFIKEIGLPDKFEDRYYQTQAVLDCLNERRLTVLSPTASGKSLILYLLARYHLKQEHEILILVPRTQLRDQLKKDFDDYSNGHDMDVHIIKGKDSRDVKKPITITTWQSVYKENIDWFKRFDCTMIDEAHLAEAKCLAGIEEKCINAKDRYGFTGTMRDGKSHEMVIKGLIGPEKRVATTRKLIDEGYLSDVKIKICLLKYPEEERIGFRKHINTLKKKKVDPRKLFSEEIDLIVGHESRMKFIHKMSNILKGNTLILFHYVDKHGIPLYERLNDNTIPTYLVHGGVNSDEREKIREIVNSSDRSRIVASLGTFSTGINIPNLDNIVLASPGKAKVQLLQSIGRGLRKSKNSDHTKVFDISDDLRIGSFINYSMRHLRTRIELYDKEEFDWEIINYSL